MATPRPARDPGPLASVGLEHALTCTSPSRAQPHHLSLSFSLSLPHSEQVEGKYNPFSFYFLL